MKSFKVNLSDRPAASVVRVDPAVGLAIALREVGLSAQPRRVLVVVGGASKLTKAGHQGVRQLFLEVLAPLAQKWQACVVDGGTDTGVMQLMGQARTAINGTFPLVGVAPIDLATLPNQTPASEDSAPLEPNHTHFLLIPGSQWGDDSPWIAQVATELANNAASVTVLINGGEITWQDALQNVQQGRSVIVVSGTGRTADLMAAALRGEATDHRADPLIASGLLKSVALSEGCEKLASMINTIFSEKS